MKVVVSGGAGYVGSHVCKQLAIMGHTPIVVDNFVYGHEYAVNWGPFHKVDILNTTTLTELFKNEKTDAVIHFAAFAYVGESVSDPAKYYKNNVVGTLSLLEAMRNSGIGKIIFSSSCATYGIPSEVPIHEELPQNPINPYGRTKLIVEKILQDFGQGYGLRSVALRYFNASGADAEGQIGEDHSPETHLIPLAIQAAYDHSKPVTVMGTDYPTPDGTCVRDYIHVTDLAIAHVSALQYVEKAGKNFSCFNLGTGKGISVKEIIENTEKVTGRKVAHLLGPRRPGDPPILVADGSKAVRELRWSPEHSDVQNIISTAARWHENRFSKKVNL
jgi:UDP-arabinose 4-epimerase